MTNHDSFPSIVRIDNKNQLQIFKNEFPQLIDIEFAIEEKMHGANIQATVQNGEIEFFSREMVLTPDTPFFSLWQTIEQPEEKQLFDFLKQYSIDNNVKLTTYFELFGGKLSKGIKYFNQSNQSAMRIIGFKVNDVMQSPKQYRKFFCDNGFENMLVKLLAIVKGIDEAVKFNPVFITTFNPMGNNFAEGVVVKPFDNWLINNGGKNIVLKIKHSKFEEKIKEKVIIEIDENLIQLNSVFKTYLNENRINSAFSKIGTINNKAQMKEYISFIMDDAKKDFEIDYENELKLLEKKDLQIVYNIGGHLANQLLKFI